MTHEGKPFGRFFFIEDPDGYKIESASARWAVSSEGVQAPHRFLPRCPPPSLPS